VVNQGHLYISLGFFFIILVVYLQFYNLININNIKKIVDECIGGLCALQVVGVGPFVDQRPSWMRQCV
jgi:hypothetical protein